VSGVAPAKNIVVVAGAGTGKTHALVERYLEALLGLDGVDDFRSPDRILAITFTEKAAAEMRARVQRRLGHLLFSPELEPSIVDKARDRGRALDEKKLEDLRRAVSGAPIHTFHAFCARVLRDHALAAGLDPSFALLEPDDERRLLAETAEACVIDALPRGALVAELVARVALHGFGERKGLVECLVDLHGTLAERGIEATSLPLATVGARTVDDALRALEGAIRALQPKASPQVVQRLMFIEESRRAVAAAFFDDGGADGTGKDKEAAVSHAFRALREHAGGGWGGKNVTDERRAIAAAVDGLGAALIDAFTVDLAPVVKELLVDLDERQRREKHARGFLAFGDLLTKTRDLLRDEPGVRARVKQRFERVLVDEYQDTSPVQEDVLAFLLEEPARGDRFSRNSDGGDDESRPLSRVVFGEGRAFLVGDPKQSIYGFRGADAGVFTRALDLVARAPSGERAELAASRRSTKPLVELANLVAGEVLPRGPFGVHPSQIVPLTSVRGGEGAAGAHWLVKPDAEGAEPSSLSPHERESLVVARKLRALVDEGRVKARDVAVLVRRGKAAVPIQRALGRVGLPAVVVGGDGFYVRPEISDVIAALTLAADPADELSVLTVLRSPLVAVPDDQILALYEAQPNGPKGLTWPHALRVAHDPRIHDDVRERIRAFDAVLTTVARRIHDPSAPGGPVALAIDALLDDGGYAAACAVEPDAALRLRNLEKLRALVERQGPGGRESALVTLARLSAAVDDPPAEPLAQSLADASERDVVRIMTIHQAKGLEFPVVVLADAGSGLKGESDDVCFDAEVGLAVTARGRPIASCAPRPQKAGQGTSTAPGPMTSIQRVRRRLRERNEGELARLLYVALTRARDLLYVVGAPRRSGPGSLLGLLDIARTAHPEAFDALLPREEVPAILPAGTQAPAPVDVATTLALPAPLPRSRVRVRAAELGARADRQLGLGLIGAPAFAGVPEEERLPPRAAGRLAHAIVGLVATEMPDAIFDDPTGARLSAVVEHAARACGAANAPTELLARCAATLAGPVRQLLDEEYALSFEESLVLERDGVRVEGRADLVARRDDRTLVVELKLAQKKARGDGALLQVCAYAAALEEAHAPALHVVTWTLGDARPDAPVPFGRAHKSRLEKALASASAGP
jgi:ATP-dependent helicase/nuclease subunit A